jgi:hypothetical protein
VFAFANVPYLFMHKFTGLGRRRLTFFLVPTRAFDGFFLRHNTLRSQLVTRDGRIFPSAGQNARNTNRRHPSMSRPVCLTMLLDMPARL